MARHAKDGYPSGTLAREMIKQNLLATAILQRIKTQRLLSTIYLDWIHECEKRGWDDPTRILGYLLDHDNSVASVTASVMVHAITGGD